MRAVHHNGRNSERCQPDASPVGAATKCEFVINLKAAKQIGLTIPQSVLYGADKVIK